jgi:hypothetical protein
MGGVLLEDWSAFLLKRLCLCVLTDEFPRIGRSNVAPVLGFCIFLLFP